MKGWFHDPRGVYWGESGAAELELLLLRREIAKAQADLLRKRGDQRGLEKITRDMAVEILERKRRA